MAARQKKPGKGSSKPVVKKVTKTPTRGRKKAWDFDYSTELLKISNYVLSDLSWGQSERVVQNSVAAELRLRGWKTHIELEVPVHFTTSIGTTIGVGMERVDILAEHDDFPAILIELKAPESCINNLALEWQIRKYLRELEPKYPGLVAYGLIIPKLPAENVNNSVIRIPSCWYS